MHLVAVREDPRRYQTCRCSPPRRRDPGCRSRPPRRVGAHVRRARSAAPDHGRHWAWASSVCPMPARGPTVAALSHRLELEDATDQQSGADDSSVSQDVLTAASDVGDALRRLGGDAALPTRCVDLRRQSVERALEPRDRLRELLTGVCLHRLKVGSDRVEGRLELIHGSLCLWVDALQLVNVRRQRVEAAAHSRLVAATATGPPQRRSRVTRSAMNLSRRDRAGSRSGVRRHFTAPFIRTWVGRSGSCG